MRREIILLVALIAILALLLYFSKSFHPASESDAKKFFLENLAQNYPDASVREIIDVVPIGDDGLRLKARVSSDLRTPCPERLHIYYNYPAKNFIYEIENITAGCVVCRDAGKCVLLWPEEAIIASHKYPGTAQAASYVRQYPDAIPVASFLPQYEGVQNVWETVWDSPSADSMVTVYISQTQNSVISIKETQKQS